MKESVYLIEIKDDNFEWGYEDQYLVIYLEDYDMWIELEEYSGRLIELSYIKDPRDMLDGTWNISRIGDL